MPPETWAELVGGVVYDAFTTGRDHGDIDDYGLLLDRHLQETPRAGKRSKTRPRSSWTTGEVQPDSQLRIPEELGGQTGYVDGYLSASRNWSSRSHDPAGRYDLGAKKDDYERPGVMEYLVVEARSEPDSLVRPPGRPFRGPPPGPDGIFRSEVFPGLWLDPAGPLRR